MSDSLLTVPNELTQSEREIIINHYLNVLGEEKTRTNHFDVDLEGKPTLFVKYGGGDVLVEASTQSFFYALAEKDDLAPGIPKVYNAFRGKGYVFLVMEKIPMPTLSTCDISHEDAVQCVASAIEWLLAQISSVPPSIFGRISSEESCVWHRFFKDHRAPVPFVNAEALSKYVSKALSRLPRGKLIPPVSFSDVLAIYYSDIRKDNFLYGVRTGKIWMIDFQHVGVLPEPFQTFTFFNIDDSFTAAVGRRLGYKPTDFANNLTRTSGLLQQMGGYGSLYLDKFGQQVFRRKIELSLT